MKIAMLHTTFECNIQGRPLLPCPIRWYKAKMLIFTALALC